MIPDFDHNHVIPPHLGNPTLPFHVSPYDCSIIDVCRKFAISKRRILILKNFIEFRKKMNDLDITHGFQWLDGSFMENIEVSQQREPNDLDLITFLDLSKINNIGFLLNNFEDFFSPNLSKMNYLLDHYHVDFSYNPLYTIEQTRYWYQLFSHNRNGIWKGILQLSLNTPNEDEYALDYLNSLK